MKIRNYCLPLSILVVLSGFLLGCSPEAATPQQIATYPRSPGGDWSLPAPPPGGRLVYDAYQALDVQDPEAAAQQAERLGQEFGGYLVNSYASYAQGTPTITLEIRIPPCNFEVARASFKSLGTLVRETVSGDWEETGSGWEHYSQFTLFFRPRARSLSLPEFANWHPAQTFQKALGISVRLIGFVVDLLIWALVLFAPVGVVFMLLFWIVRFSLARIQR